MMARQGENWKPLENQELDENCREILVDVEAKSKNIL